MAFNFGFRHREPWAKNYWFMLFLLGFFVVHCIVIFVPSKLSCLFRINCNNENSLPGALDSCKAPIRWRKEGGGGVHITSSRSPKLSLFSFSLFLSSPPHPPIFLL